MAQNTISTNHDVRQANMTNVLSLLIHSEPLSRTDIAKRLHVSLSTVCRVSSDLIEEGYVLETGAGSSTGGRIPKLVTINPNAKLVGAIEVSPYSIRIDVLDLRGQLLVSKQVPFSKEDDVVEGVLNCYHQLLGEHRIDGDKLLALVVALPGAVDPRSGTVCLAPNLGWMENRPLASQIQDGISSNTTVLLENDVNAAAYGEYRHRPSDVKSLIFLRIDSGLGAGLVLDGQIWRGSKNLSGEIGYSLIGPEYLGKDFGSKGCLETYCGGTAILERFEHVIETAPTGGVDQSDEQRLRRYYELSASGNSEIQQVLDDMAREVGIILHNIASFIDPDLIVVNGWAVSEVLLQSVNRIIDQVSVNPIRAEASLYGKNAVISGVRLLAKELGEKQLLQSIKEGV